MVDFGGDRINDALDDDAVEIDLGDDDDDDQPEPSVARVAREVRAELERGTFRDGGDRRRDDHDERRDIEILFEARDSAGTVLRQAPLMRRESGDQRAAEVVHAAVSQFLREAESFLTQTEPGREVWYDTGGEILGTVRLPRPTPTPGENYELHEDDPRLVDTSAPSRMIRGDKIVFRCLKDYLDARNPITATWEFESISTATFDPDVTTREKTEETPPPRSLSGTVYRQCRGALQAAGVGADVSEGEKSLWGPEDAEETI